LNELTTEDTEIRRKEREEEVMKVAHEGKLVKLGAILVGWAPPTSPTPCGAEGWKAVGGAHPTKRESLSTRNPS
jgi:hypothetical protein